MLRPATTAGRQGLAALRAAPSAAVVIVDYDGTLAPVVPRPEDARPQPGAVEALVGLAGKVRQVAVVTGRPADVAVRLGRLDRVPELVVLGQYGVQRWHGGVLVSAPPAPGLDAARSGLAALDLGVGVEVEDKGLSLVVHTRRAADPVGSLVSLAGPVAAVAADAGLELHPGRLVLELRPPGYDKGVALLSLVHEPSAVLFAGDDVGDLAAFDAVDALRARGTPGLLVCSDSDEAPAQLRQRADLVVAGPPGVVEVLRDLLG